MSTKDQLFFSALHGTASRRVPQPGRIIEEPRQITDGRNDVLAEVADIEVCSWYASAAVHVGYELLGAGMLIATHRRSRAIDAIEAPLCC